MEPERLLTSNLNTRLRQSLLSRLPATLRKIGINAARSGLRSALETLAKGCHEMWVARRAAKRVGKMQVPTSGEMSDVDSVDTILLWLDEDAFEVSHQIKKRPKTWTTCRTICLQ